MAIKRKITDLTDYTLEYPNTIMSWNDNIYCDYCDNSNNLQCSTCEMEVGCDCPAIALDSGDYYHIYDCISCGRIIEVELNHDEMFATGMPVCLTYTHEEYDAAVLQFEQDDTFMDRDEDEDDIMDLDEYFELKYGNKDYGKGKNKNLFKDDEDDFDWSFYSKCRHYNAELEFPNGVKIFPSSHTSRNPGDPRPDFALYLDGIWSPPCVALFIDWPDFSIPKNYVAACLSIIETYNKAKEGLWVEIGCIGGHGRTGTVLACMAVLSGVKGSEAVAWVKNNYCNKAVESDSQEWFVLFFDAFINGGEVMAKSEYKISEKKRNDKDYVMEQPYVFAESIGPDFDPIRDLSTGYPPPELIQKKVEQSYKTKVKKDKKEKGKVPKLFPMWYDDKEEEVHDSY